MNRFGVIALLMAAAWAPQAGAQQSVNSGENWLRICSSDQPSNTVTCISYIMGIDAGLQMQAALDERKPPFCEVRGLTNGQKKDLFAKFLTDHPEMRQENAAMSYLVAMRQAFPCPQ